MTRITTSLLCYPLKSMISVWTTHFLCNLIRSKKKALLINNHQTKTQQSQSNRSSVASHCSHEAPCYRWALNLLSPQTYPKSRIAPQTSAPYASPWSQWIVKTSKKYHFTVSKCDWLLLYLKKEKKILWFTQWKTPWTPAMRWMHSPTPWLQLCQSRWE